MLYLHTKGYIFLEAFNFLRLLIVDKSFIWLINIGNTNAKITNKLCTHPFDKYYNGECAGFYGYQAAE